MVRVKTAQLDGYSHVLRYICLLILYRINSSDFNMKAISNDKNANDIRDTSRINK